MVDRDEGKEYNKDIKRNKVKSMFMIPGFFSTKAVADLAYLIEIYAEKVAEANKKNYRSEDIWEAKAVLQNITNILARLDRR